MKLHVGCGEKIFSGWTNLDIDDLPGVDIIDDARKLSKIPIFSSPSTTLAPLKTHCPACTRLLAHASFTPSSSSVWQQNRF